ncbi:MAG: dienelactone hydrolase family protein, partial [Myxococcales bacterium]|nr:dienelactone hydrolase family protein [Myxococcales bacterium]
ANASCPVLWLYGGADGGIPVSTAVDLSEALEKSGTPYEVHVYGGAPHAFFNDTRESYRGDVAEHSLQTTLARLENNLS